MSQPYIGEIRMFGGNFAPQGWMTCDGQMLSIAENDALFNLIGTTYGGDGVQTFGLPNLSGKVPLHMGTSSTGTTYNQAQIGGVAAVTLAVAQLPVHSHAVIADNNVADTTATVPTNDFYGATASTKLYSAKATGLQTMMNLPPQGGSRPHDNVQPSLAITFIISLYGIFPSPT